MATHRVVDGTITIKADHDSGTVILIVRDDTGRETEVQLRTADADIVGFAIMDAGDEL